MLAHYGVSLYFVSDRLDSRDEAFRVAYIIKGIGDEQYVRGLSQKVHRSQEGCVLRGYAAGGTCYGYRNRSIPDPDQSGRGGTTKTLGVKMEIIPEEADIVRRIMEMRAEGLGFGTISKKLNADGVAARSENTRARLASGGIHRRLRKSAAMKSITASEYGTGRSRSSIPPMGRRRNGSRPPSEWVRVEVPSLRIIPDELWEKVHAVNQRNYDKSYGRRLGGMNRTESSRTYLFSGVMTCGLCEGPFTVVGGKLPKIFYGCRNHRYRHSCSARTTIRREQLEQQLIAAISVNLLDPRLEEERFRQFKGQLKKRSNWRRNWLVKRN